MVVHLLRLKLALIRNSVRRSAWQVIGMALGALYGLAIALGVLAATPLLSRQDPEFVVAYVVIVGSLLMAGWIFIPLVMSGADMTLDPRRFVTFSIRPRELLTGLTLASLIGVPGIVSIIFVMATAGVWAQSPEVIAVAVVTGLVGLITCVILSRGVTTVLSTVLSSRRFREVLTLTAVVPILLFVILIMNSANQGPRRFDADRLPQVGDWLSLTPFGAIWGIPGEITLGNWGRAALLAGIAVVTLVFGIGLWAWGLKRTMTSPTDGPRGSRQGHGLGVFRLAKGPLGAMTARSITYWMRDPRYAVSLTVVPLLPFMLVLWQGPQGIVMLLFAPLVGYLLGWSISVDIGYDGSAFWQQLASGIPGRIDRWGRNLAVLTIAVPLMVVCAVGTLWMTQRWDLVPVVVGGCVGAIGVTLGLASVISARFIYPVPQAGDNPFSSPSGSTAINLVTQLLSFVILTVLLAPLLIVGFMAMRRGESVLVWATLGVGVLLGGGVLWAGTRWGGRMIDRRGPQLLQQVLSFK